jgi:hypothetical protein
MEEGDLMRSDAELAAALWPHLAADRRAAATLAHPTLDARELEVQAALEPPEAIPAEVPAPRHRDDGLDDELVAVMAQHTERKLQDEAAREERRLARERAEVQAEKATREAAWAVQEREARAKVRRRLGLE